MKLIAEWKQAHKFLSVRMSAFGGVAMTAWIATPDEQKHSLLKIIGHDAPTWFAAIGFFAVIFSRVVSQKPPEDDK